MERATVEEEMATAAVGKAAEESMAESSAGASTAAAARTEASARRCNRVFQNWKAACIPCRQQWMIRVTPC